IARPCARAMPSTPTWPLVTASVMIAPAPMKISVKVPIPSASSGFHVACITHLPCWVTDAGAGRIRGECRRPPRADPLVAEFDGAGAFSRGVPSSHALPFVALSGIVHSGYMIALTRAYDDGDLSLVYPIARGVAPVVATAGAAAVFRETLPPPAYAGIGLIALGVLLLGAPHGGAAAPPQARGLPWSLVPPLT